MSITTAQIVVGDYYVTPGPKPQLRKVTGTTKDAQGRTRVRYGAKSSLIPGRAFAPAGTMANPALDKTFADACDRVLTAKEVSALRKSNILLATE